MMNRLIIIDLLEGTKMLYVTVKFMSSNNLNQFYLNASMIATINRPSKQDNTSDLIFDSPFGLSRFKTNGWKVISKTKKFNGISVDFINKLLIVLYLLKRYPLFWITERVVFGYGKKIYGKFALLMEKYMNAWAIRRII